MKVSPYLNFNGNCRAAFNFYVEHLGGKISFMMTHGDSPVASDVREGWESAILYAHMTIGTSELMGSDIPPEHQLPMRSAYLYFEAADAGDAERVFSALEKDGLVIMPIGETFWAHRFGTLRDQFGVLWMVGASKPMPQA